MKILYGVQATGNGHITRARAMLPALQRAGIDVDFIFSGRPVRDLFDMDIFGHYRCFSGFTFKTDQGKVQSLQTLLQAQPLQFLRDVRALDVNQYDLVLTDFEPISAWAAKRQKRLCVGLAHQYALKYKVPGTQRAPWLKHSLSAFAPATHYLGIHWQAFNAPILPPLISSLPCAPHEAEPSMILVYLPFEETSQVVSWLQGCPEQYFRVYTQVDYPLYYKNVHLVPLSRTQFPLDLVASQGVICNSGFGLCSEALVAGKKILTKPLKGQIEQVCNAKALVQMQKGTLLKRFDPNELLEWLKQPCATPMVFPPVADAIAAWLASGCEEPVARFVESVWGI
ncbi:hypothetical protein DN062_10105 [Nitrincola tibetensis]|uniref:Glycosyltransferase n=1 Tax=Nitrincola tibetensis TaxID=2219697 RepID=A0A364NM07_9GAMM|nr:glycosyltransferase family protein [Nitrincola tibetensis]RAU18123.1 hypothetical protein DN062_10105 [Nitrincola tibetensis]